MSKGSQGAVIQQRAGLITARQDSAMGSSKGKGQCGWGSVQKRKVMRGRAAEEAATESSTGKVRRLQEEPWKTTVEP